MSTPKKNQVTKTEENKLRGGGAKGGRVLHCLSTVGQSNFSQQGSPDPRPYMQHFLQNVGYERPLCLLLL